MKKLILALSLLSSVQTLAMPNPQYVALAEVMEFGKYVYDNMEDIIESSMELAKATIPNKHYFLYTEKIEIDTNHVLDRGTYLIAILHMDSADLKCQRKVYLEKTMDAFGGPLARKYTLSPEITCQVKAQSSQSSIDPN